MWGDLIRGGGDEPARAACEAEVLQLSGLRDLLRVGGLGLGLGLGLGHGTEHRHYAVHCGLLGFRVRVRV